MNFDNLAGIKDLNEKQREEVLELIRQELGK